MSNEMRTAATSDLTSNENPAVDSIDLSRLDELDSPERDRVAALFAALTEMSDAELRSEIAVWVLNAAIIPSLGSSLRLDGLAAESERRALAAGGDAYCAVHSLYSLGWSDAYRSQGHRRTPQTCSCAVATPSG